MTLDRALAALVASLWPLLYLGGLLADSVANRLPASKP